MSRTRYFWTIALLLTIAAAVVFFPIEAFERGGVYYALVMGVLVGFQSFLVIAEVRSFSALRTAMFDKDAPTNTPLNAFIPVMVFIVSGFVIYQLINYRIDYLLKTEGVYAEATVEQGQQEFVKQIGSWSESYSVQVSFADAKTAKDYTFSSSISRALYSMIYKGESVRVLYLPQQPTIFRLMVGENIERYEQKQNRKLRLQDLEGLFACASPAEVLAALKRISPTWVEGNADELPDRPIVVEGRVFYNDQLEERLLLSTHGIALYESAYTYDFLQRAALLEEPETISSSSEEGKSEKITVYKTAAYTVKRVEVITFRRVPVSIAAYYLAMRND
nr:hypothetical protein [uncultured Capnocytophaga sp.]